MATLRCWVSAKCSPFNHRRNVQMSTLLEALRLKGGRIQLNVFPCRGMVSLEIEGESGCRKLAHMRIFSRSCWKHRLEDGRMRVSMSLSRELISPEDWGQNQLAMLSSKQSKPSCRRKIYWKKCVLPSEIHWSSEATNRVSVSRNGIIESLKAKLAGSALPEKRKPSEALQTNFAFNYPMIPVHDMETRKVAS